MKKIISIIISLIILIGIQVTAFIPAYAAETTGLINDMSNVASTVSATAGMIFEQSDVSPDGACLAIQYETQIAQLNIKNTVDDANRAAAFGGKRYFGFWIKTPYTETKSGIYMGLFENSPNNNATAAAKEMVWNGNAKETYTGQVLTISKTGEISYIEATKLLTLNPGFEGYVCYSLDKTMGIHPGWAKDNNFEEQYVSGIQIWFDENSPAWDEYYYFDNFSMFASEEEFLQMVKSGGINVQGSLSDSTADTNNNNNADNTNTNNNANTNTNNTDTNTNTNANTNNTVNAGQNNTNVSGGNCNCNSEARNILVLVFIILEVVLTAGIALLFIYRPNCIFNRKKVKKDKQEDNTEVDSSEQE